MHVGIKSRDFSFIFEMIQDRDVVTMEYQVLIESHTYPTQLCKFKWLEGIGKFSATQNTTSASA